MFSLFIVIGIYPQSKYDMLSEGSHEGCLSYKMSLLESNIPSLRIAALGSE